MKRFSVPLFFLSVLICFSHCASTSRVADPDSSQVADDRLERIEMTNLHGKSFSLKQLKGRPVFLNFWATWCAPCISEMRSIEELHQEFEGKVTFLAVSTEDLEKIQAFKEKEGFTFEFARLDIDYLQAFVIKLPTTLLIDAKGNLVAEEEGARIWTLHNNRERIQGLVGE